MALGSLPALTNKTGDSFVGQSPNDYTKRWNRPIFDAQVGTEGGYQTDEMYTDNPSRCFLHPSLDATRGVVNVKHLLVAYIQEQIQQTHNVAITTTLEAEEFLIDEDIPYAPKATYRVKVRVRSVSQGEPSQLLEMDFEDALLD